MIRSFTRFLLGSSFFLIAVFAGDRSVCAQLYIPAFNQVVVFGDSFSDTGNVRARTEAVDYPSQTFNYSDGRFTNGDDTIPSSTSYAGVWHEQLARDFLHIPVATYSLGGGTNYSFGGATTENGSHDIPIVSTGAGELVITVDELGKQVDDYFAAHAIDPNALYIIWGGGNDIFSDVSAANVSAAAVRVAELVGRLATAGAEYIMVPNVPPLGTIPIPADPSITQAWNTASSNFRKELRVNLNVKVGLLASQGITPTIYQVDIWEDMIRLFCNPGTDGFTDTRTESQGNLDVNPDHFVFWDEVHPTTAGHYWTARCAYNTLATLPASQAKAVNISTRLFVDNGERIPVAGFIVTGSVPKRLLIRGLGPSLHAIGVTNPLRDPTLTVVDQLQNTVATNDNWRETQETGILATGIPPPDNLEAAIIVSLPPGCYTALLAGKNGGTGIGLIEIYDLDPGANATLANLSTRGFVGTGNNAMIGGVLIGEGDSPLIVLRAVGPSLAGAGIADPLLDPTIELYDGNGAVIEANDDWREGPLQAVQATELAPLDDRESAIVAFLAPGNYTAVVRGSGDASGVALVEVYRVP